MSFNNGDDIWGSGPSDSHNLQSNANFGETDNGIDGGENIIRDFGQGRLSNGGCFNCGEDGHMKSECPNPRAGGQNSGLCYNCGETGHNKVDCSNPAVSREFQGTCRLCEKEGHRAADCPDAGPRLCKNCGQEGHPIIECKNARKLNFDGVEDVSADVAWDEVKTAAENGDIDDVKIAVKKYIKAQPDATYVQLEKAFRNFHLPVYVMGLERETLASTYTNMDLQGNLDKKYTVSYRLSDKPKRPKEADGWPASAEENFERLADAGEPVDRGIPKCSNCDQLGHTAKSCPDDKLEPTDRATVHCNNCDQDGHRLRDCRNPRPDKFTCRNCNGQPGHGAKECPEPRNPENVECKKCGEMGHFSRDCSQGGGGGGGCRNCGQPGHHSKDFKCTEPPKCRNCDEIGHVSKECPKPRDYSRVQCSNCKEMGHTKVRCMKPLVEEPRNDDFGAGDAPENDFGGDGVGAGNSAFGEGTFDSVDAAPADAGPWATAAKDTW